MKVENDGVFEFYDSRIYNNLGSSAFIALITSTQTQSRINNSTISGNKIVLTADVLNDIIPNGNFKSINHL